MEEKITIIVPVYNVEKYIKKCIQSIINQTYPNIEVILVNDGSTDNSGKICEEFAKQDKRIIVINKQNGGLSDARNKGIEIATGKYIGFVDSDDCIKENMFEILYNNLKQTNADISVCSFVKVNEQGELIDKKSQIDKKEILEYNKQQAMGQLVSEKIGSYAWNKLYKKEIFNNIIFPLGRKMEDLAIMYLLFEKANKIVVTNETGYYYLQRKNSILGNVNLKLITDLQYFVNQRYHYILTNYPELKDKCIINRLENIHIYHRNLCEIKEKKAFSAKEFIEEYKFYKENLKCFRKKVFENKSRVFKIEYMLLYVNRNLFKYYYGLKKLIQRRK